jgi:hypothetical protein
MVPLQRSGQVVHIHIRDDLIDEKYHIDIGACNMIGRMAGNSSVRISDRFDVKVADDFNEQWRPLQARPYVAS